MADSLGGIRVVMIAAANAPDWAKLEADIVCDGHDDEQAFGWALEQLEEAGGGFIRPVGAFHFRKGGSD